MAYKYSGLVIREGRSWTDNNGVKHPSNWASMWSEEEKTSMGLIWEAPAEPIDTRFYKSLGVAKNLNDVTNDDGSVTKGLKTVAIEKAKKTANGLLSQTDWYIVRQAETGTAVPSEVSTYRSAVRSAVATIESAISNAADLDAFMALYIVPVDADLNPIGNAPISDYPEAL